MLMTPHEWWLAGAVLAVAALSLAAAYLWYFRPGHRGSGRHVLGGPVFDGDEGSWPDEGPRALLHPGLPPIDWAAAPRPDPPADMAEFHADIYGVPAPKYTELDAWRAEEESAERLAGTATRFMVASIIRGLEYRDGIDGRAGLIIATAYAELSIISAGLS